MCASPAPSSSSSSESSSTSTDVCVTLIGGYLSPYVRKVLVCLHLCHVKYQVDPLVPFFGNDNFSALSPLRRIPVLVLQDGTALHDSSVICNYLYDTAVRLDKCELWYGANPVEAAQLRWLEEYADTRLSSAALGLYGERIVAPVIWRRPINEETVQKYVSVELPTILNYLEKSPYLQLSAPKGMLSIADVSIAAFLRNAQMAGWQMDDTKWPALAERLNQVFAHPAFASLTKFEEVCSNQRPAQHSKVLKDAGAPVVDSNKFNLWDDKPRPGIPLTRL